MDRAPIPQDPSPPTLSLRRIVSLFDRILRSAPVRILAAFLAFAFVIDSEAARTAGGMAVVLRIASFFGIYLLLVLALERRRVPELDLKACMPELLLGIALGIAVGAPHLLRIVLTGGTPAAASEVPVLLAAAGVAAVSEELLFRGVILRITEESVGTVAALLFSSLLFAVVHERSQFVETLLAGLALGACFLVTRRLWLPIGGHFTHNALTDLLPAPESWSPWAQNVPVAIVAVALFALALRQGKVRAPGWWRKRLAPPRERSGPELGLRRLERP